MEGDRADNLSDATDLYYQASEILKKINHGKGTIKTLTYASGYKNLRQMFALVSECVKYSQFLEEIAEKCPGALLHHEAINGDLQIAVVLLYEHLLGRKFGRAVQLRRLFQSFKGDIRCVVEEVITKHGAKSLRDAVKASSHVAIPKIPRYMRVNLIKSTVEDAIKNLQEIQWEFVGKFSQEKFSTEALALTQYQFGLDPVLPDVLVFAPSTDLHDHEMTMSGTLVQQDRASCIPAHALSPTPGSLVVDSCAAPGNKTSHLASLMNNQGQVIALDRDFKRLGTMSRLLGNSGATCLELVHQDFLTVETSSEDAANVRFILVDPSCSGSGMLNSQTNSAAGSEVDSNRVQTLKRFQISILKHALQFPNTERVVYSTCSVHQEENEEVAEEVMSQVEQEFRFRKVLPQWHGSRGLKEFEHADNFLRLTPGKDLTQGFFVACFERVRSADIQKDSETVVETQNSVRHENNEQGDNTKETDNSKSKKRKRKNVPYNSESSESSADREEKRLVSNGDDGDVVKPQMDVNGNRVEENGKSEPSKAKKKKKKKMLLKPVKNT